MAWDLATRLHFAAGNAAAASRIVFTGSGICFLVMVSNTDDTNEDTVEIQNSAGTVLAVIEVGPNGSVRWDPHVVLDNGMVVVSGASAATTFITTTYRPQ